MVRQFNKEYKTKNANNSSFCFAISIALLRSDFLCFLIWPFIESYWLAAVALLSLTPTKPGIEGPQWIDEKKFSNRTQALGKTLYYQGDLVSVPLSPGSIPNMPRNNRY
jgi:hypothetical protein